MKKSESASMVDGTDAVLFESHASTASLASSTEAALKHVAPEDIPDSSDLLSRTELEKQISDRGESPLSVIVVGDIMLGGRAKKAVAEFGPDYPFDGVLPLLRRVPIVLGNLEGPFAEKARKLQRNFSYRVDVSLASSLSRAGINVVTLANNHLMDCGRSGVLETLDVLSHANVFALGAGTNERAAHAPVIRQAGGIRIGLLGYYWNRRTAATMDHPGSAMDPPEALETDIRALRKHADRIVVTFHWGVPYEREPSPDDRAKAHFAVDCGADAVVGHHPHVVQPFEIYCGCPIFYSVGNFAFGSGNSRAEGLLVGLRFEDYQTLVNVYPLYVKNRDPRVNYQPKVLVGKAAERVLTEMIKTSGENATFMKLQNGRGHFELPRPGRASEARKGIHEYQS
jgi:poly-gamma-glutamate capsule biosynthesis protein CapA/YwtB (metallophosphatase superfamily)